MNVKSIINTKLMLYGQAALEDLQCEYHARLHTERRKAGFELMSKPRSIERAPSQPSNVNETPSDREESGKELRYPRKLVDNTAAG